jgi:hypothetical protein
LKKKVRPPSRLSLTLVLTLGLCLMATWPTRSQEHERVSTFFDYQGYTRPTYEKWTRTSQYITVRDGTRLAADIYRPAGGDVVAAAEKLPVVWTYERYMRATVRDRTTVNKLEREPWLREMLRHGYVVGVVEARGTGASFGMWDGPFSPREADDGYDVTEWFAAQGWCNQRVGMFGRSYMGVVQLMTAGAAPPHLKAVFAEMTAFDLYETVYSGGVYRQPFVEGFGALVKQADTSGRAAPVDADADGALLAQALEEHRRNRDFAALCASLPYRDSADAATGGRFYITRSPSAYLDGVNRSGVAVYLLSGWHDLWARDAFLWFNNLHVPRRLVVGPWSHRRSDGVNLVAEHLRWFDYWLKGIDNGIKDEPPLTYYTNNTADGHNWRAESRWPPAAVRPATFYFNAGRSGSVNSVNDGLLDSVQPAAEADSDAYRTDYSTSSGPATRWTDVYQGAFGYRDLTSNDERALTYTTPPLTSDIEVTGHPVVRLWATSDAPDGDFFVYLEDVSEQGRSQYVTEGALKASHRAVHPPPFDYFELPFHRSFAENGARLPTAPAELAFDLYPTSYVFKSGHRIRVSITGADQDNASTPTAAPAPTIRLHRDRRFASHMVLPILPEGAQRSELLRPPTGSSTESDETDSAPVPSRYVVLTLLTFALLATATFATIVIRRTIRRRHRS